MPEIVQNRDTLIDSVRTIALTAVIVVNMMTISGLAYMTPDMRAETLGTVNLAAWFAIDALVESKAMAAFSFMFGLSFSLILQKAQETGEPLDMQFLRRLLVLGGIGVFNALFLFWADILMSYALLGLILPLAARLPRPLVTALALALLLAGPVSMALVGLDAPKPVPEGHVQSLDAFASSDYADVVYQNWQMVANAPSDANSMLAVRFFALSGLFLLGLAVGRSGFLDHLPHYRQPLLRAGALFVGLGLTLELALVFEWATGPETALFHLSAPLMALGYLMVLTSVLQGVPRLRRFLAPLGRMSLTGYLMSAALGQLVFYGWGFQLIGAVGTLGVVAIALALVLVLLSFAHLWFRLYRHGPWEWLWRSLSRMRWQPIAQ
ncbi:MAG: uncharacterized protein HLUCCA12_08895 [Rhodobacteraceae bacterium HLUCCA12]|nr:MAG: uncharacterized protein HLUCCA12_08895 [Rhodobacteraceae bacterium HLUCCA12]